MIGKCRSIVHGKNALNYCLQKDKSEELFRCKLSGENADEISREFHAIAMQNGNCRNNVLRIELSPTIDDGQKLNNEQLAMISKKFMCKMNLDKNRQWIAVAHRDRAHVHIHIIANRIDFSGNAFRDNHISNRAAAAAEFVAKELGLTTAKEVQQLKQQQTLAEKEHIRTAHEIALHQVYSFDEYCNFMKRNGIEVALKYRRKTDTVEGMSFIYNGKRIKSSDIGKTFGYKNTMAAINKSVSKKIKYARQTIKRTASSRDFGI